MENQEKVRTFRSTPCQWMRFFHLKKFEHFFIGKRQASKLSVCSAIHVTSSGIHVGLIFWVNPFRRVKTARPVRRSPVKRVENPGKTHFVGDDCPGGHHELAKSLGSLDLPRGDESNNANNITGPTC